MPIVTGTVAYACITFRHRRRGWTADRGVFEVALTDGRRFFAMTPRPFYDGRNQPVQPFGLSAGSTVNLSVDGNTMQAVQVVTVVDDSPFPIVG
jgi:hypothetical protein